MKSIIYNKEKKRSTQRFMTFALVLALLLFLFNILTSRAFAGLFAPGSGVAEVNGEGYATLSEALSAWTEGSTLRLTSDVTTDSTINVPTGEHILDLNGYGIKMTGSGSVINIVGGANLRVDDSNEDALHRFNVSNAQSNGAGLATVDDSLTSGYKTFKGGYITGGNASSGGGILIASNAYLTLNGGTVIGNQSSWMGAGIKNSNTDDTEGKSFIMNGGSIIYNSISGWGSGVCSDSGVTINGGTIAYNYASKNPAGIHGHYIYINGGCIENNYSNGTEYASGVHSDHEVFISGDTVICGNLTNGDPYNLDWDRTEYKHGHMINITGALSDNAKIGVTMCISGTGQFTSGWKDNMGNAEPSKYFTSDKSIYKVKLNNGEAELVEPSLFDGSGTEEKPYLIRSVHDWNTLADSVLGGNSYADKCFKLTDDITVTRGIGGGLSSNDIVAPFSGTFDGGGHTLTVNIETGAVCAAPFFDVAGTTTIKNLRVDGYVKGGGHPGGLVGGATGTLKLENVLVTADVSGSIVGGIIGHGFVSDITMDSCAYTGNLQASNWSGGFLAWGGPWGNIQSRNNCTLSINNCLFAGSRSDSKNFHPIGLADGGGSCCNIISNSNTWSTLDTNTNSSIPTGDTSFRFTAATVTESKSSSRPWMGYFDVVDCLPVEGTYAYAVSTWSNGKILALLTDVNTPETTKAPSGTHTLDLNGYELKRTGTTGSDNSGLAMTVGDGVDLTVTGPGRITGGKGFHGGGIHVEGNSFLVLDNCEVSGNTGHYGGGLYLKKGTITLKNGTVVKENSASEGYGGSGIYAEGGGTLIMDGCTFTGNAINNNSQYAVFLCGNANIKISGAPVIYDNTYSDTQKNLYMFQAGDQHSSVLIEGTLTDGMNIGVGQTTVTGEFTSGWKDNMGDADPSKYFTSDNTDYVVFMNSNGELEIGKGFVPDVSAEGFEGDYDGKSHSISVSVPDGATVKYGTQEGSYTLSENPTYTDAGTYKVYYEVSKKDYASVQGFAEVKIDQINATVTITGHNTTVDYDGKTHEVSGYDAVSDSELYDVTKDFEFTGTAQAKRINAGTTKMGLDAKQFKNKNSNFATVTFNVTDGYIKIDPIDVTVTITGHNTTVDYDGKTHEVSGYDAVSDSELYDVTKDFEFTGTAQAKRTSAGTTKMGLDTKQFKNKNSNFATVTFNVTDGYIKINPIDVTVTVTGHNTTVDYDGKTHEVSGYDAQADSELYDVTEDFTYHGIAEAMRTNAGTTDMGLKVEEFENTNSNFKTVTFIVTDGYLCIRKVNAVITTAPRSREELVYNDSEQELIVAGTVEGGKLYYAIGSDSTSVPADSKFKDSLPVGKDVGNYYIWYKVIADFNHNSVAPACLKVTLAEEGWTTIKGIIHDADNNPVKGATVSLTSGGRTIDTIISESDGGYYFTAPAGVYNIVVNTGEATVTDMVDIFESKTYNVNISDANTDSVLDISDSDKDIVVGGLNKEADLVRAEEDISSDKNVSVRMTVTPVSVGSTEAVSAIGEYAADMNLEYYGFKVEKTVDSQTTYLDETQTVLEIVIPCSFTNKKELTVYNSDGTDVQSLTESNSGESGTFRVDKNSGLVYIYTDRITTYALGYKPYYSVKSYMTLGSFTGKVDVKLTKNGETVYELNDVSLDEVSFKGVSKGTYSMTVTWTDGAENTLTTPFKIK